MAGNPPYDLLSAVYRPLLARFASAAADPAAAQRARLLALLRADASCEYGRRHGFAGIADAAEPERAFRAHVPAVDFDALAPSIERMERGERGVLTAQDVVRFVKTSGTTGRPKRVPITPGLAREVRDAQLVWLVHLLRENPKHADGAKLVLVSPADEERTPAGIPVGANTGRMQRALPWFVRLWTVPPAEVLALRDPGLRGPLSALAAAGGDLGSITTANASTVWQLATRLRAWGEWLGVALREGGVPRAGPDGTGIPEPVRARLRRRFPSRPARAERLARALASGGGLFPALWPRLTTVNCWRGGPAAFYLRKLEDELGGIPVRDPGYSASEGFFAIPLESGTAAGVLHVGGPYFEFEPVGTNGAAVGPGAAVGAGEIEVGGEYEVRVTTAGGLWRYAMRDVVRVVGRHLRAPLVEFVRKSESFLSITGEKVSDVQVLAAADEAAAKAGIALAAAGAEVVLDEPPCYVLIAERRTGGGAGEPSRGGTVAPSDARAAGLVAAFDRSLQAANVEYAAKRADGRLGPARLRFVPSGAFEARRLAMASRGGPESQVKMPVLFPDGF